MEGSKPSQYNKDLCDLRHETQVKEAESLRDEDRKLWAAIEEIINPATGHIAILRVDLERKIDRQDSRLNGLIISIITVAVSVAIAIGAEFFKKFVK